jgi:hypothetical protein
MRNRDALLAMFNMNRDCLTSHRTYGVSGHNYANMPTKQFSRERGTQARLHSHCSPAR